MTGETVPAPTPVAQAPLLALDRQELRLPDRQGEVATAALLVSNQGGAPLKGSVVVRLGADWLQADPAALVVPPGESCRVEVRGDPSLAAGQSLGELAVITNGGALVVPVTLETNGASVVALLPLIAVAGLLLAAVATMFVVAGRQSVASPAPTSTARPGAHRSAGHRGSRQEQAGRATGTDAQQGGQAVDPRAAAAAVRSAVATSDAVWQAALMLPSASALASAKTGGDLAQTAAEVRDLLAGGQQWEIVPRSFRVEPQSIVVAADGRSASAVVDKAEQRSLYASDRSGGALETSTAAYRLRYHLVSRQGRWLVDQVSVLALTPLGASPSLSSVEQVAARVLPMVVRVQADASGQTAVGTGFVVHSTAQVSYVVTNDHVVQGAGRVEVQRAAGGGAASGPWVASAVWEDAADDLAVLRIPRGNLPVAAWDDSSGLKPAQQVVAIGYAEDLSGGPTITAGIVSSLQRTSPDAPSGPTFIQHSAIINHGNSGGPLVDMSGRVVGINTWSLAGTQGLFFAIPSSRAAPVVAGWTGSNG